MNKKIKIIPFFAILASLFVSCGSNKTTNEISLHPYDEHLRYELASNAAEYTVYGNYVFYPNDIQYINIPSMHDGLPVTSIGEFAFFNCSSLTTITIPSSVTSIGESAFKGCSSLTSITVPSSVTSIGKNAFQECTSLKSLTLPYIDTYLGYYFGASSSNYNLGYVPSSLKEVIILGGSKIPDDAFYGCRSLTSITIQNSVTSIGNYAFDTCSSLTSITIPSSVTSIGLEAFSICNSLQYNEYENCYYLGNDENPYLVLIKAKDTSVTGVTINENTKIIYDYAFDGCSSLTSLTIPSSVTSIGRDAFYGCDFLQYKKYSNCYYLGNEDNPYLILIKAKDTSITNVTINENTRFIYANAFEYCSSLTTITIPSSVTSIGRDAFEYCSSLKNVYYNGTIENWCNIEFSTYASNPMGSAARYFYMLKANNVYDKVTNIVIPNTVTSIRNYQFIHFNTVISIEIPNSVTSIEYSAFSNCTNLQTITFESESKLESIGDYAFMFCGSLTSITIPSSVTSIGLYAFYYCTNLKRATFENESKLESIGDEAFEYCRSLTSITIPSSVTSIGTRAFYECNSLQYNEYGNCYYLGNEDNPYLALIEAKDTNITNATIKENTKVICGSAFRNCSSLTSITIPSSVTSIGWHAFSYCTNLQTVTFESGSKLEIIGRYAFEYCSSLTSIVIPSSVTSIRPCAFYWCTNLQTVTFENGSKLESIGFDAFFYCSSLTSIVILSSVTSIGQSAFSKCSSLTIYCEASSELGWNSEWNYDRRPVYWKGQWSYVNGVPTPNN
ncbi:MAG: leucine-rich repeat domain-containing protein [Erysipelotrichales bacterium]|nr:leucine-rich repeat domain-containing protein [Erysipelotrichales bacterium]